MLPGQGIFQYAGIPHAYLEGQNIELMANSDNVLRGGLTTKHIDVPELLKHTRFEGIIPDVLSGEAMGKYENYYACPVEDFGLSVIGLRQNERYQNKALSGEIFLILEGSVMTEDKKLFKRGEAFFVLPEIEFSVLAMEKTVIYKAFVPHK